MTRPRTIFPHPRRAARYAGFSLIELLAVGSIIAVLLALAAPSFAGSIRNSRLTSQVTQLVYSLNLARSEAVKRAGSATICKSSSGTACGTSGVNWEDGWMVFSDLDQDQVFDAGDGEVVLQINQALIDGFTLRGSADVADAVTFDSTGNSAVLGTFAICTEGRADYARAVGVSLTGRILRGADSDADGIPEAVDGSEIASCTAP